MSSLFGIILTAFRSKFVGAISTETYSSRELESKSGSKEPEHRPTSGLWTVSKNILEWIQKFGCEADSGKNQFLSSFWDRLEFESVEFYLACFLILEKKMEIRRNRIALETYSPPRPEDPFTPEEVEDLQNIANLIFQGMQQQRPDTEILAQIEQISPLDHRPTQNLENE